MQLDQGKENVKKSIDKTVGFYYFIRLFTNNKVVVVKDSIHITVSFNILYKTQFI